MVPKRYGSTAFGLGYTSSTASDRSPILCGSANFDQFNLLPFWTLANFCIRFQSGDMMQSRDL
jgi:hypothetical protein